MGLLDLLYRPGSDEQPGGLLGRWDRPQPIPLGMFPYQPKPDYSALLAQATPEQLAILLRLQKQTVAPPTTGTRG